MKHEELAVWLIEQCNERHLSWTEACRGAGISPNSISQIVNGIPPGVKRLTALAEFFNRPVDEVFRMAGLLPPQPDSDNHHLRAERRRMLQRIADIWHELDQVDPVSLDRLTEIATSQAEMVLHAAKAARRLDDDCNGNEEEETQDPNHNTKEETESRPKQKR